MQSSIQCRMWFSSVIVSKFVLFCLFTSSISHVEMFWKWTSCWNSFPIGSDHLGLEEALEIKIVVIKFGVGIRFTCMYLSNLYWFGWLAQQCIEPRCDNNDDVLLFYKLARGNVLTVFWCWLIVTFHFNSNKLAMYSLNIRVFFTNGYVCLTFCKTHGWHCKK